MRSPLHAKSYVLAGACCLALVACRKHDAGAPAVAAKTVGQGGLTVVNPDSARPFFHDFGHVVYGEQLSHVFRLRNDEGRALVIHDMLASCGCTQPRVAYTAGDGTRVEGTNQHVSGPKGDVITLPKDVTADVTIDIDTTLVQTMNMDKLAQVRIRTDADANPYLTLELHVVVVRAFRAVPARLELGETPQSAGKSARTDVTTEVRGNGSRIKAIDKVEGTFTADLQESRVNGETDWILTATAPPGLPLGPARGSVTLTTTKPDGTGDDAPFTVPILAQVVPDVVVHPGTLALNVASARGGTLDAEIVCLVPGASARVVSARLEGERAGQLGIATRPVTADDSGRSQRHVLTLSAPAGLATGAINGRAVIALDDPSMPQVVVPFSVTVR